MDEEVVEFNIAHNRKYSIDHLWYQEKDDEKIMVGISEFMGVEIGEVLRVILPQAETMVDEGQDMFSLWTGDEKIAFTAPFSGTITEVNGEVEINPDPSTSLHTISAGFWFCNRSSSIWRICSNPTNTSSISPNFDATKWNHVESIAAIEGITSRCTHHLER